jgi:hypothetical protein
MRTTAFLLASCALSFLASACSNEHDDPVESASASPAEIRRPTESRLIERSKERWRLSSAGEWIDVYDLLSPKVKKQMSLYAFLDGKQHHVFNDPSAPRLVGVEGAKAYTEVTVTWTPQHPALMRAEIPEGESLTERFELIETWEWVENDWYLEWPPERPAEFFEQHPDLLKKSGSKDEVAPAGAEGEPK